MSNGNINQAWRRNALLATAGIFMLLAIFTHPGLLLYFALPKVMLPLILRAAAGFLAAKGIRELANIFLRKPGNPWYCRPRAFVFLAIIMLPINAFYTVYDDLVFDTLPMNHNIHYYITNILEFMAFELLWIVLLELPFLNSTAKNTALNRKPIVTCGKQNSLNQSRTEK